MLRLSENRFSIWSIKRTLFCHQGNLGRKKLIAAAAAKIVWEAVDFDIEMRWNKKREESKDLLTLLRFS